MLTAPTQARSRAEFWLRIVLVIGLLFLFLTGIQGLGAGFKSLGKDLVNDFFQATSNPFVALVIGILGTTLVQSSSVTTSLIVALVAAPDNPLPVANAVPMIMGANIGTTVTNTIVSLGHIGQKEEFRRAFGAATCHDFFNFICVAIFLPLELATGFLEKSAGAVTRVLAGTEGFKFANPLKDATKFVIRPIKHLLSDLFGSSHAEAVALIMISVGVIFVALYFIVKTLRRVTAARMESMVRQSLKFNPHLGLIVGMIVTVMVQSSSITTSIMIPLAGAGLVTVRQVFPITLGANMGTTITAMLAALATGAPAALQIALVHLFFNLSGTLLLYPVEKVRDIPIRMAEVLANLAVNSRRYALLYVVVLFYGLPALMVFLTR